MLVSLTPLSSDKIDCRAFMFGEVSFLEGYPRSLARHRKMVGLFGVAGDLCVVKEEWFGRGIGVLGS